MANQQRVLVTAGASGIGLAVAQAFLDAGAWVLIADVDAEAVKREARPDVGLYGVVANVADKQDVAVLFERVDEFMDGIDVLVNGAGLSGPTAAVEDVDFDAWQQSLDVTLSGTFLCMQESIRRMKPKKNGSIINISSASTKVGMLNRSPYLAAKRAVEGLTQAAARELGPFNIRCNAILPGAVNSARMQMIMEKHAEKQDLSVEEVAREYTRYISLQRLMEPEDIANAAVFLGSPASKNISGQLLAVDGNLEWEI